MINVNRTISNLNHPFLYQRNACWVVTSIVKETALEKLSFYLQQSQELCLFLLELCFMFDFRRTTKCAAIM